MPIERKTVVWLLERVLYNVGSRKFLKAGCRRSERVLRRIIGTLVATESYQG